MVLVALDISEFLFARALGAEKVVAISRRSNKKEEAIQLGADLYIATEEEPGWAERHARSLDIIVSTASSANVSSILCYMSHI